MTYCIPDHVTYRQRLEAILNGPVQNGKMGTQKARLKFKTTYTFLWIKYPNQSESSLKRGFKNQIERHEPTLLIT